MAGCKFGRRSGARHSPGCRGRRCGWWARRRPGPTSSRYHPACSRQRPRRSGGHRGSPGPSSPRPDGAAAASAGDAIGDRRTPHVRHEQPGPASAAIATAAAAAAAAPSGGRPGPGLGTLGGSVGLIGGRGDRRAAGTGASRRIPAAANTAGVKANAMQAADLRRATERQIHHHSRRIQHG